MEKLLQKSTNIDVNTYAILEIKIYNFLTSDYQIV
jgi:hypothetical protein